MIVEKITEHEDGSATVEVELTPEELRLVVSRALRDMLTRYVEEELNK